MNVLNTVKPTYLERTAIITPMYQRMEQDGVEGISRTVNHLEDLAQKGHTVYLVEDGSKDGSQEWLKQYISDNSTKINIILRPENGQKVGAIKDAVEALPEDIDYVLLTDDDTHITNPEGIEDVIDLIEDQGHAGSALKVIPAEVKRENYDSGDRIRDKIKDSANYGWAQFLRVLQDIDYAHSRVWAGYTTNQEIEDPDYEGKRPLRQLAKDKFRVKHNNSKVRCLAGAGGLWKRDVIEKALQNHSMRHNGDDMELTALVMGEGHSVTYSPKITMETETPKSYRDLLKQRIRWDLGAIETYVKEKDFYLSDIVGFFKGLKNPKKNWGKHRLAHTTMYEWSVFAGVPIVTYGAIQSLKEGDTTYLENYFAVDLAYNIIFTSIAIKQKEVRSVRQALASIPSLVAYRAALTYPGKTVAFAKFMNNEGIYKLKLFGGRMIDKLKDGFIYKNKITDPIVNTSTIKD
jgi:cellulose synthase/poly-beta-1,6-N-acetylglucosamine synthase-like glycosyltransferase